MKKERRITYPKILLLFIAGSLLGILLEGIFCKLKYGQWETHVVTVWAPLCIIYGVGMAGCYIGSVLMESKSFIKKFLVFAAVGTAVELAAGLILEFGLNMRAWDYTNSFMNVRGHICLGATLIWGALGLLFGFAVPYIEKAFDKVNKKPLKAMCAVITVFLIADLTVSAICFDRWSERHEGIPASNAVERLIDGKYDDSFMQKRFVEWRFIK